MFPAKTLVCTENYKSMLLLMSSLLYINSHSPQIILEMTILIWNMMVHTLDQVLEQYIFLVCSVLELSIDLKTAGDIGLLIIIIFTIMIGVLPAKMVQSYVLSLVLFLTLYL